MFNSWVKINSSILSISKIIMKSMNIGTIFSGAWFIYLEPINRDHPAMPEVEQLMLKYINSYIGEFEIASWTYDQEFSAIKLTITRDNHDQNIGKLVRNVKTSVVKHMKRNKPDVIDEIAPIFHTGYVATTESNWVDIVKSARNKIF